MRNHYTLLLAIALPLAAQTNLITPITVLPKGDLSAVGELRFRDKQATPHYVGFKAPGSIGTNLVWELPAADSAGCVQSSGAGVLSIATCNAASGSDTWVQYNKGGILFGDSNLVWDYIHARLGIGTTAPAGLLHLSAPVDTVGLLLDNGVLIQQKSAAGVPQNLLTHYSDDNVYLDNRTGSISIRTGSLASTMWLDANGNVGIGTTAPAQLLTVNGDSQLHNLYFGSGNTYDVGTTATPAHYGFFESALGTQKLQLYDPTDPGGMTGAFWYQYADDVAAYEWGLVDNAGHPALIVHRGNIAGVDKYLASDGDIVPALNNTYSVGRSGNTMSKLWSQDGDFAGDLVVHGTCTGCGFTTPGADTQILYNKSGSPFADANLIWDYAGQNLDLTGNLHFGTNNTYDVGTTTAAAHYGYFQSALGTTKLQVYDFSAGDLSGAFWNVQGQANGSSSQLAIIDNGGTSVFVIHRVSSSSTDKRFEVDGDFNPTTNNTWNLGTTSVRWKKLWGEDADFGGTVGIASANITALNVTGCTGCGVTLPISDFSALLVNGGNTFTGKFALGSLTGNAVWTMPDTGTIPSLSSINTWSGINTFSDGATISGPNGGYGLQASLSATTAAVLTNNTGAGYGLYDISANGSYITHTLQVAGFLSVGGAASVSGSATVAGDLGVGGKFTADSASGKVTKYSNTSTVDAGVPYLIYSSSAHNQTVTQTLNILPGGSNPVSGMYRLTLVTGCDVVDTGASGDFLTPSISYIDIAGGGWSGVQLNPVQSGDTSTAFMPHSMNCGTATSVGDGPATFTTTVVHVGGAMSIAIDTFNNPWTGSAKYYYYVSVEKLQ